VSDAEHGYLPSAPLEPAPAAQFIAPASALKKDQPIRIENSPVEDEQTKLQQKI
jgi:hypothetical protein